MTTFDAITKKPLENIVAKGENAGNQHFLLFPQCLSPLQIESIEFHCLQTLSNWNKGKILSTGKRLICGM